MKRNIKQIRVEIKKGERVNVNVTYSVHELVCAFPCFYCEVSLFTLDTIYWSWYIYAKITCVCVCLYLSVVRFFLGFCFVFNLLTHKMVFSAGRKRNKIQLQKICVQGKKVMLLWSDMECIHLYSEHHLENVFKRTDGIEFDIAGFKTLLLLL